MKISIIGSGYVGLVTGACFADLGHHVLCVDNNEEKIAKLKSGIVPFYEPGLQEMVRANFHEGRLQFSDSVQEGTRHGQVIFIAVGTPPKETGEADLSSIERVSREIAETMDTYKVIVEKSTVPVQTGEWVEKTIAKYIKPGVEFDVASNPEFLAEGTAIHDFMHPDRVVIGISSDRAAGLLVKLYEPLNAPLLLTDIKSAELIKHSANAFLALKISFINAVAHICELSGADVERVAKGIGLDDRIGMKFLRPGIGFGGSCFPKDVSAYICISQQLGYDFKLLKEVEEINRFARQNVITKLKNVLGQDLKDKTVTLWGLAFKPNTDDIRSAPSLDIIKMLKEEKAIIRAYDPVAMDNARMLEPDVIYCQDPYQSAEGADAIILVTEWQEFRYLDLIRIKEKVRRPIVIDGRNLFDPCRLKSLGFTYLGVGKKEASAREKLEAGCAK